MEKIIYKSIREIEYDLVIADKVLKYDYKAIFPEDTLFVDAGEGAKTFEFLERIIKFMQDKTIDRSSKIAVVGGGSLSDVIGFAAGIYMRGIKHDIIPTTLLSMVDACVGGKTAINFNHTKNMVGMFNEAQNVIIDSKFTQTESLENLKNGVVEALKLAALFDRDVFYEMSKLIDFEMTNRDEFVELAIKYSPVKKQQIVKEDFKDKGIRQLLNAGHTVAHAIESYENYNISHGKAVAIGLVIEHEAFEKDTSKIFSDLFSDLYGSDFLHLVDKYKRLKLDFSEDKKSHGAMINIPIINEIGDSEIITLAKEDFSRRVYFG